MHCQMFMEELMASRVLVLFLFLVSTQAMAGEPAWCNPKTFSKYEYALPSEGLVRAHLYKIGGLEIVGLAVGRSDIPTVQKLAQDLAHVPVAGVKSCTWYLNEGNDAASEAYNHIYLPRPYPWSGKNSMAKTYGERFGPAIAGNDVDLLGCAQDYGYVAFGCDGEKHRGPSAFAMLLSYTGCSAENANKIANQIWGLNTVPSATRKAIAQKGADLGDANPQARAAFQTLMSAAQ
jgi:hypothetical protein